MSLNSIVFIEIRFRVHIDEFMSTSFRENQKFIVENTVFDGLENNQLTIFELRIVQCDFIIANRLAASQTASYSYVSEFHTQELATRAVTLATICMNTIPCLIATLSILIIPMDWTIHIFVIDFTPWRLFLICNSLVNLVNGIVFSILPESPKFLLTFNQKEKALDVLKRVYAFNTDQPQEVNYIMR